MGETIELEAADGHRLGGYKVGPEGEAIGGIVVLQEIFGVNHHIRSICDRLAGEGFVAVAPALFDRITPDFQSGYSEQDVTTARGFIPKVDWDAMLLDTEAAAKALADDKPKALLGFCLGGSLAYLAAVRQVGYAASVCFYGGKIVGFADQAPLCPTQMHFGDQDHGIPMSDVETIKAKRPDCEIHVYPAGHGFNCDERGSYSAGDAKLAFGRSVEFLERQIS